MNFGELLRQVIEWFEGEGWEIEREEHRVVALMSSGYGSGPAEVDITALATRIHASLPR